MEDGAATPAHPRLLRHRPRPLPGSRRHGHQWEKATPPPQPIRDRGGVGAGPYARAVASPGTRGLDRDWDGCSPRAWTALTVPAAWCSQQGSGPSC